MAIVRIIVRVMKTTIVLAAAALTLPAGFFGAPRIAAAPETVDSAFAKFWDARSPDEAAKTIDRIVKAGVGFDEALARLKRGRPYRNDAPHGVLARVRRSIEGDFNYTIDVPDTYDASRRYQVRVQLHGGVMMRENGAPRAARGGPMNVTLRGDEQIYVMPTAWRDAPWWSESQVDNLRSILDTLKRTYNVDENRVALAGVSDGATATYYVAMRDTTPYASFESLNGFIMVLGNESLGISGDLYASNLRNKPFFAVNGGLDPLYPAARVEPFIQQLVRAGVAVDYHPRPDGVHSTAWWPDVKDSFESFVRAHPRNPLPDRLTWETDRGGAGGRAHWLSIDKLAPGAGDAAMDASNLFPRGRPSGRVDLSHSGNAITVSTRGVAEFTLLLSPDAFDLARPITVTVNGQTTFDGRVPPSVETLLKWAARDNDRTMLFAAELYVKVK
jgi:predicted esterase